MSPKELAEIKDRLLSSIRYGKTTFQQMSVDISRLIAEVERLQASLKLERQAHRLTFDIGLKCALEKNQHSGLTGLDKISTTEPAAWDEGMR